MKNISHYIASKYSNNLYEEIEPYIYKRDDMYVSTMSFQQEPELGEGSDASMISQYPLEDILDKFYVHIADFYKAENISGSEICYLEFASTDIEDIRKLHTIVGKHVYNQNYLEDGKEYVRLVIE